MPPPAGWEFEPRTKALDNRKVTVASLKALERDRVVVVPSVIFKIAVFLGCLGLV